MEYGMFMYGGCAPKYHATFSSTRTVFPGAMVVDVMQCGASYEEAPLDERKSLVEVLCVWFQLFVDGIRLLGLCTLMLFDHLKRVLTTAERKNISGQLALVTGSAHGLGQAIARKLAQLGCNVALVDIDLEVAAGVAHVIRTVTGVQARAYKTNVADFGAVKALSAQIEEEMGPVDLLVNNAGIFQLGRICDGQPSDIDRLLDVNLKSHFWMVRVFLENMLRRKRGHIVGISSIAGLESFGGAIGYSASKFAIRGFMDSLKDELMLDGHDKHVKTTVVYPAFVRTQKHHADCFADIDLLKVMPLDKERAADIIVDGILQNKTSIILPSYLRSFMAMFLNFPLEIRHVVKRTLLQNAMRKPML